LNIARTVRNSGILALLGPIGFFCFVATAQPASRASEFLCTASDVQERLPLIVRFRITTPLEIEARAIDKSGKESRPSVLRRNEVPDPSRAAVFLMGGQLGVSGDVRMLISQTALEFGEVGTIMIINQSTRENVAYQCAAVKAPVAKATTGKTVGAL
jgi:hypothetical protein